MNSLRDIPVAVLAGGLGTRLRSAVPDTPKVLASVAGRPFLHWLLEDLARAGFGRVVLCTGYRADLVAQTLGSTFGPLHLAYSPEPTPLGTGGAVRLALPLLGDGPCMLMNGDSYCRVDFAATWSAHRQSAARVTMVVVHVDNAARYGAVELDDRQQVTRFTEKQPGGTAPGWINAGVYCLSAGLVATVDAGIPVSLERDVFPALVGRGLSAVRSPGPFIDIGTPESYAQAAAFFSAGLPGATTAPPAKADA